MRKISRADATILAEVLWLRLLQVPSFRLDLPITFSEFLIEAMESAGFEVED